jgi:hypothetical protein
MPKPPESPHPLSPGGRYLYHQGPLNLYPLVAGTGYHQGPLDVYPLVAVCRNHQSPLTLYPLVAGTGYHQGPLDVYFPPQRGILHPS